MFEAFPQTIKDFEAFITEYQDKLIKHAFFKLGSLSEAEDLVQDVFVKIFLEKDKFKTVSKPYLYVFKMVNNACIDSIRKKIRYRVAPDTELKQVESGTITDQELIYLQEYERINNMLSQIPVEQAEILSLRIIDELSFVEIAEMLNSAVTTIKSRFKYGMDKLRDNLKINSTHSNTYQTDSIENK